MEECPPDDRQSGDSEMEWTSEKRTETNGKSSEEIYFPFGSFVSNVVVFKVISRSKI